MMAASHFQLLDSLLSDYPLLVIRYNPRLVTIARSHDDDDSMTM